MRLQFFAILTSATLLPGTAPAWAHGESEHSGHGAQTVAIPTNTAFGRAGNPAKVMRTIQIEMSDTMRFTPAVLSTKPGETVRFVLHNGGQTLHEMVLGDTKALKEHAAMMQQDPGMNHGDMSMVHVKPGATGELVWQFTQTGKFDYACLLPGHFEAGMVGQIEVR